eukprot:CAMPEP_0198262402 /NCGR_PEP_ID=MMETSP1447-20131203/10918_1 /TAXON_ID=420782 /ORGANISM="Chaetoceros dichaeta, Strain CCMP1751" /LENGTH=696 /DNA_ID=CAMNT_0043950629 /DNA_START=111 /DNA_END=2201 /DNA_ORIENTATION=-
MSAKVGDVDTHKAPRNEGTSESEDQGSDNRIAQVTITNDPQNGGGRITPEKSEVDAQIVQCEFTPDTNDSDGLESVSFETTSTYAAASISDNFYDHSSPVKEKSTASNHVVTGSSISEVFPDARMRAKDKLAADIATDGNDSIDGPTLLLRDFSREEEDCSIKCNSQLTSISEPSKKFKFEAGDHVIRWKLLKAVLYPIQIHGIVLSVEVIQGEVDNAGNPSVKVVIADFGYTKSQSYDDDGKTKKGKGLNLNINKMMQSYYNLNKKVGSNSQSKIFRNDLSPSKEPDRERLDIKHKSHLGDTIPSDHETSGINETSVDDEKLKQNSSGKRFRVICLTEPKHIKKWSKINYGSLFSPDGKIAKMKSWISKSLKKIHIDNDSAEHLKDNPKSDTSCVNDNLKGIMSPTALDSKETPRSRKDSDVQGKIPPMVDEDGHQSTTLAQLMTEANKIEKRNRSRRRFSPRKKSINADTNASSASHPISRNSFNMFTKSWFGGSSRKVCAKEEDSPYSLLTVGCENSEVEGDTKNTPSNPSANESHSEHRQKLPKSDPRKIVLARTKYILAQQDLPESESTLPPYHVLYSNSECLAVWCKTGTFSTLQAAVFLHSTAVGNAKSTVALTAAVGATQPWLIPFVGIYGIVAIGMPYYLLKRCHVKWKEGEALLTDGFWSTADPIVFVEAIEKWSGLGGGLHEQSI